MPKFEILLCTQTANDRFSLFFQNHFGTNLLSIQQKAISIIYKNKKKNKIKLKIAKREF